MKYLALSADGNIHSLGDCGDWCCANEIAEEYMDIEPVWITTIDEWVKLADTINNQKES